MGPCLSSSNTKPPKPDSPPPENSNMQKPDQTIENTKNGPRETTSQANPNNEKKPDEIIIIENNEKIKKPEEIIENKEKINKSSNPNQNSSNGKADRLSIMKKDQQAIGDSNLGKSGLNKLKSQDPEDLGEEQTNTFLVNQKNKQEKNKKLILE